MTTNGRCAAIAAATVVRSRSRSGGSAVVTVFGSTPGSSTGFLDGIAFSPTSGAAEWRSTTVFPSAWIFLLPPIGSARIQYFPGFGMSSVVT